MGFRCNNDPSLDTVSLQRQTADATTDAHFSFSCEYTRSTVLPRISWVVAIDDGIDDDMGDDIGATAVPNRNSCFNNRMAGTLHTHCYPKRNSYPNEMINATIRATPIKSHLPDNPRRKSSGPRKINPNAEPTDVTMVTNPSLALARSVEPQHPTTTMVTLPSSRKIVNRGIQS